MLWDKRLGLLREHSANKPVYPNKKHLPNLISSLNKAPALYPGSPRSTVRAVDTYLV